MKTVQRICSFVLLMCLCGVAVLQAQTYDALWKQVEQAQKKSLPQTVVKLADKIYRKAADERNAPQMMKAVLCRDAYSERLTPDSLYTNLDNLEQWVRQEPDAANRAILHSLLAYRYADYWQAHSYQLSSRTALEVDEAPTDIRTWTTNLFVATIDAHLQASLHAADTLMAVSAKDYLPLVVTGESSRYYGHDLYHLLVRRAVGCYRLLNGQGTDSLAQDRIEAIYQEQRTRRANQPEALLLVSLDYWQWRYEVESSAPLLYGFERKMRQQKKVDECLVAMEQLIGQYASFDLCAEAYLRKAQLLSSNQNPKRRIGEAIATCDEALKRYPHYPRINELRNLRANLLRPTLSLQMADGGCPGDSLSMKVQYSNGGGNFTLQLYATNLTKAPRANHGLYRDTYSKYIMRRLSSRHYALPPLLEKGKAEADVPYLESDTVLKIAVPETAGIYLLLAVPDKPSAPREEAHFFYSSRLKVRLLSLGDGRMEVTSLDARSGQPEPGVTVHFYASGAYDNQKTEEDPVASVVTGTDGKAVLPDPKANSFAAYKEGDLGMPLQPFYGMNSYIRSAEQKENLLTLLTDRSIYRPGQTVHLKGVAYTQQKDDAQVVENATYELRLLDANRKEIASQTARTNDFGSFTTDFLLPTACLNGSFTIQTADRRFATTFRVEEYKRPTFEIVFAPITHAYCLGEQILLKGNVKAFSGQSVQDVPLAYTVSRSNLLGWFDASEKPLKADTLRLDADGSFSLPILLEKPQQVNRFDRYFFRVEVAVTSEAGETQTANCQLAVGEEAIRMTATVPSVMCRETLPACMVQAANAQEVPLALEGTFRLYAVDDSSGTEQEEPGRLLRSGSFRSGEALPSTVWEELPSGNYRLMLATADSLGHQAEQTASFYLFSRQDRRLAAAFPLFCRLEQAEFDEQHPGLLYIGTSCRDAYVQMDLCSGGRRIESRDLQLSDTLFCVEIPYREAYGDGLSILLSMVKDGVAYDPCVELKKARPDRTLGLKWEVFRDRLLPGQQEEWKLVVTTPQGTPADAELLALMYDASLDKLFRRHQQLQVLFRRYLYGVRHHFSQYGTLFFSPHFTVKDWRVPGWSFDRFCLPYEYGGNPLVIVNDDAAVVNNVRSESSVVPLSRSTAKVAMEAKYAATSADSGAGGAEEAAVSDTMDEADAGLLQPMEGVRTDFAETAFFYPQLRTDSLGRISFSFTVPQSLTRWNVCGYAHTRDMQTGQLDASVLTAKEFMLTPNLPRFLRVGDRAQLAASIANQTATTVKGTAVLTLFDPQTEKVLLSHKQKFTIEAGRTAAVAFQIEVTDRCPLLGVRLVADADSFSDGEQHLLPVLSNQEYVTETLPMPVRGGQKRTFSLDSLFNHDSRTATRRRLTVEFTGNPAWMAILALPSLGSQQPENAVCQASAFYARTLAAHILNSQPRIRTLFESWKQAAGSNGVPGTREAFLSQLEKNQELKNILLAETPWLMEAEGESERQARLATFFDPNQLAAGNDLLLAKLREAQRPDGAWSWYPGMPASPYITTYVTELLVRLPLLTDQPLNDVARSLQQKAFGYLHQQAMEQYRSLREQEKKGIRVKGLSGFALDYLYLLTLSGEPVPEASRKAYDYFLSKVSGNLEQESMLCKARSAVILQQAGRASEAAPFIASLKEHLVQTEERGAYFAFNEEGRAYTWEVQPVQIHVAAMEALQLVGGEEATVEEMKLWLLKQKQANSWQSPVATADAVYALLCRGDNWLESQGDVSISLGNRTLRTQGDAGRTILPGLSYLKETFLQGSPELKARTLTVEKQDAGIAWGAVYAQYLSPMSDIGSYAGGELRVAKRLYVERTSADGQRSLQPLDDGKGKQLVTLRAGDKVVARLTLTLDRAMDFVQLKDRRGACFEPQEALSGYRRGDGTGYYVEVEDAATNYFFDHLAKGVYVVEHSYRVARAGSYEAGIATAQCAYAPEYASHSAGCQVTVLSY